MGRCFEAGSRRGRGEREEWLRALPAKLCVGAKADELERRGVWLSVNEDEVRPDVTVAVILPLAGQRMIAVA